MAYKVFAAGTPALASDINTYLMNQSVMVFATNTARDTALPTPTEGMVCYVLNQDHFQVYSGTAWVLWDLGWNAFTPTWAGVTLGAGATSTAYYVRIGKTVIVHCNLALGTASTVTGTITMTVPVNFADYTLGLNLGNVSMTTSAGVEYQGTVRSNSGNTVKFNAINASATYATAALQTTTIPFTWTANLNHTINMTFMYRGA
jgi:hypothetical protein